MNFEIMRRVCKNSASQKTTLYRHQHPNLQTLSHRPKNYKIKNASLVIVLTLRSFSKV